MINPKVSVIVPCYNQAMFLSEALESVFKQTEINWECIIINDGSIDNTKEVASNWLKRDVRFIYIETSNKGLSNARNEGIKRALGTYILPLDADDIISEKYIELALKEFEANSNLKIVYSRAEKFGDENGEWKLNTFSLKNLASENMIFSSAFFKKEDWSIVNGYDIKMIYGWEDWEFWISILKNGGEVKCIEGVHFYYRIKEGSMTKQLDDEKFKYLKDYLSIKHADFFVKHLGSFFDIKNKVIIKHVKDDYSDKIRSKKFLLKQLCYLLFQIDIFKDNSVKLNNKQ